MTYYFDLGSGVSLQINAIAAPSIKQVEDYKAMSEEQKEKKIFYVRQKLEGVVFFQKEYKAEALILDSEQAWKLQDAIKEVSQMYADYDSTMMYDFLYG